MKKTYSLFVIVFLCLLFGSCSFLHQSNDESSSDELIHKLNKLHISIQDIDTYEKDGLKGISRITDTMTLPDQTLVSLHKLKIYIHVYNLDQKKDFQLSEEDLMDLYSGEEDKWQEFNDFYWWYWHAIKYKSDYTKAGGDLCNDYYSGLRVVNRLYHSQTGEYFKGEENIAYLTFDDLCALETWGIENIDENLAKEDEDYYMFLLIMGCELN